MFITVIVWHSAQQPVKHDTRWSNTRRKLCVRNKDNGSALILRHPWVTETPGTRQHFWPLTHQHIIIKHTHTRVSHPHSALQNDMITCEAFNPDRLVKSGIPCYKNTIHQNIMNEVFCCFRACRWIIKPAENMSRPYFKLN